MIILDVLSMVFLLLHALIKFSGQIRHLYGNKISYCLQTLEKTKLGIFGSFVVSIIGTSILQSSTAMSAICISLVNVKIVGIFSLIPILLGSIIGSATTSFLFLVDLSAVAAILFLVGFVLKNSFKRKVHGNLMLYLGLVFISIKQISDIGIIAKQNPLVIHFLSIAQNVPFLIFAGILTTFILQSSGVVSGVAILFVENNLISLDSAGYIIIGSIIGTSGTGLILSLGMKKEAKSAAIMNSILHTVVSLICCLFFRHLIDISLFFAKNNQAIAATIANLIFRSFGVIVLMTIFTIMSADFKKMKYFQIDKS